MPYLGFTQEQYPQALINEYKWASASPKYVFPQSFNLNDVIYWIQNEPEFEKQLIYLDGRYEQKGFNAAQPELLKPTMRELYAKGVRYIAPPIWLYHGFLLSQLCYLRSCKRSAITGLFFYNKILNS